jgi:hypothetical protein
MSSIQPLPDLEATASDAILITLPVEAPPTPASLFREAATLRDRVESTRNDATELHYDSAEMVLDERTTVVGLQDPAQLLEALAVEWGLSWAAIARLLGVSATAIRKWRRGDQITSQNRRRLARLSAFLETLCASYPIGDVASWLEMQISDEAVVTPVDLYTANRIDLLLDLAGRRETARAVLDRFADDWRDRYAVDAQFDVITAPDGQRSIVQRERR